MANRKKPVTKGKLSAEMLEFINWRSRNLVKKIERFSAACKPPASPYDLVLLAEARQRGIRPLPSATALNNPWRRRIREQIGDKVVMEILLRRKRGQRGPGKQLETRKTGTDKNKLAQMRDAYHQSKARLYDILD
jgi:hypothetical protein